MIAIAIVACEVGFWVVLLAGLAARYPLGRPRLGLALIASAPLIDLALLVLTVADLEAGGHASPAHALAAVYIGVSLSFGHRMIAWADARFAHRFASGPVPASMAEPPLRAFARHGRAWAIGVGLLLAGVALVGDAERTGALLEVAATWTAVLAADGLLQLRRASASRRPIPG